MRKESGMDERKFKRNILTQSIITIILLFIYSLDYKKIKIGLNSNLLYERVSAIIVNIISLLIILILSVLTINDIILISKTNRNHRKREKIDKYISYVLVFLLYLKTFLIYLI